MSLSGRYMGRFCARTIATLIVPIALPAWTIERSVNRFKPGWQFSPFMATPYFLTFTLLSSLALMYRGTFWVALATYAMTAMQLLAVWLCISIGIGRPGEIFMWLREFGKRKHEVPKHHVLLNPQSLYIGIVSYGFTIYYFAFIDFLIYRVAPDSFNGIRENTPIGILWVFTYFSTATITTLGYGDIAPRTLIAQATTVMELFVGFFFVVFLFGSFVSYQVSKLR